MIEVNSLEEARNYPDAAHIECGQTYKVYFKDEELPDYLVVNCGQPQDHIEPEVVINPIIEDMNKQIGILAQDSEFLYNQIGLLNQSIKNQKEENKEFNKYIMSQMDWLKEEVSLLAVARAAKELPKVNKKSWPEFHKPKPWWKFWSKA